MNEMALSNSSVFENEDDEAKLNNGRNRWTAVLLSSSVLAVLSGLAGITFSTVTWVFQDTTKGVSELGTLLTVAFFPLLMIAAHSLDKIRDAEKSLRLEYCRRHPLKDKDC